MSFLPNFFYVRGREESSWTLLVRNRTTIFIRSKFVIYFSILNKNIEVSLCKYLQSTVKIVSLATCKVNRTDLLLLLPKDLNYLTWKLKANICNTMTEQKVCWEWRSRFQHTLKIFTFIV